MLAGGELVAIGRIAAQHPSAAAVLLVGPRHPGHGVERRESLAGGVQQLPRALPLPRPAQPLAVRELCAGQAERVVGQAVQLGRLIKQLRGVVVGGQQPAAAQRQGAAAGAGRLLLEAVGQLGRLVAPVATHQRLDQVGRQRRVRGGVAEAERALAVKRALQGRDRIRSLAGTKRQQPARGVGGERLVGQTQPLGQLQLAGDVHLDLAGLPAGGADPGQDAVRPGLVVGAAGLARSLDRQLQIADGGRPLPGTALQPALRRQRVGQHGGRRALAGGHRVGQHRAGAIPFRGERQRHAQVGPQLQVVGQLAQRLVGGGEGQPRGLAGVAQEHLRGGCCHLSIQRGGAGRTRRQPARALRRLQRQSGLTGADAGVDRLDQRQRSGGRVDRLQQVCRRAHQVERAQRGAGAGLDPASQQIGAGGLDAGHVELLHLVEAVAGGGDRAHPLRAVGCRQDQAGAGLAVGLERGRAQVGARGGGEPAAPLGRAADVAHRCGHCRVRLHRRQRHVPGPLVLAALLHERRGKGGVRRAHIRRGGQVVDGGCHQRVAEDDAVGREHDQAGQLGRLQGRHLEMLDGEGTSHGHHLVAAGGRGDQQRAAGGAGQLFKPLAEHVLRPAAGRNRLDQGLGAGTLGIGQGTGQLDQRQRVAAGEGGQLRGYGRVHGSRRARQLGGGIRLQAVQLDHGQAARVKGAGGRAHRDQHGHALGVQPAGQERHHLGGGPVEPVSVVDHDQQRLALGRDRHQVERRDADGQRLGVHRRADRERSGQRLSLHVAKGTDVLLERPQQLGQRCERELALGLEPAGREHGHAVARSHGILE